jgi:hypothetical protein
VFCAWGANGRALPVSIAFFFFSPDGLGQTSFSMDGDNSVWFAARQPTHRACGNVHSLSVDNLLNTGPNAINSQLRERIFGLLAEFNVRPVGIAAPLARQGSRNAFVYLCAGD